MNENIKADVYTFDDLLVACSQEIMINGIDSPVIPGGIKDWVSGKLLSALPKRLVQQLLASLIENRNLVDTIDFREKKGQNRSEFTLVMYKSEKAREKHQKKILKDDVGTHTMNYLNNDLMQDLMNSQSAQMIDSDDDNHKQTIFKDSDLTNPGLKFYSDVMLADHTQSIIATNQPFRKAKHNRTAAYEIWDENYQSDPSDTDPAPTDENLHKHPYCDKKSLINSNKTDSNNSNSDNNSDSDTAPKKMKVIAPLAGYKDPNCKKKKFQRKSRNRPPTTSISLTLQEKKQHVDDYFKNYSGKTMSDYARLKDISTSTFNRWCMDYKNVTIDDRIKNKKRPFMSRYHEELLAMEEVIYDNEKAGYTCTLCGIVVQDGGRMKRHVEQVHKKLEKYVCELCGKGYTTQQGLVWHKYSHTGEYRFNCEFCGKGFQSKHRLIELHTKNNHKEEYLKIKQMKDKFNT